MSNKFKVEMISPDRSIIEIDTSEVIIPSFEGEMGILKDHIPLITFLRPGVIKIHGEIEKKYFVEEGIVEFTNNNLIILTSTAKDLANLDKNSLELQINDAEAKIKNENLTDKEKFILFYKIDTLKNINQ